MDDENYISKDAIMQIIFDYSIPSKNGARHIKYKDAIIVIQKILDLLAEREK